MPDNKISLMVIKYLCNSSTTTEVELADVLCIQGELSSWYGMIEKFIIQCVRHLPHNHTLPPTEIIH